MTDSNSRLLAKITAAQRAAQTHFTATGFYDDELNAVLNTAFEVVSNLKDNGTEGVLAEGYLLAVWDLSENVALETFLRLKKGRATVNGINIDTLEQVVSEIKEEAKASLENRAEFEKTQISGGAHGGEVTHVVVR